MTDIEARGCLETRRGYIHCHMSETAWQCRTEYLENSAVCRIVNGYSLFIWFLLDIYNTAVAECGPLIACKQALCMGYSEICF